MPKAPEGLVGPRTMLLQITELGIDRKANSLDQGTPAL
jgi:hypothetical protein